ncbi:amidohydrolase family protein, partial [Caulobacter sp. UNC279MFTsu5.1]|uniref:amidohydrolase family protein n=1 Tax=Caulobacter sp. UNC279MFTsu5.1 TaxID=1502775 RepID=UPI0008F45391
MSRSAQLDLLLVNGKFTTLDRSNPRADAALIRDGKFAAVGEEGEVRAAAGPDATVIDAGGRRVIPGLIDSHMHVIRG